MKRERAERCGCTVIHQDVLDRVRPRMPDEVLAADLAAFFKVFGDPTRVRILSGLFLAEMCVCDIAALVQMSQSSVSHQLRVLKQARLVRFRREGRVVYYSLADEHIKTIFDQGLRHLTEK